MPKLPEFLYCTNQALPSGLVLFTRPPFFIGKIMLFHNPDDYVEFLKVWENKNEFSVITKIEGYRIIILYSGSLQHIVIDRHKDIIEEVFHRMADFFLKEKVQKKSGYYKRYIEKE